MTESELLAALHALFPDAQVTEKDGDFFWFAPNDKKKMMPFLTLVTSDSHDTASDLARSGVYRLNLGLSAEEFTARFGPAPKPRPDWSILETGHDYAARDTLIPHPIYGALNWMCVLNPSPETLAELRPLLLAGYERAARRSY